MTDIDTLRSMPLFVGLTDAQVGGVLKVARRRRVSRRTVILREGEQSDSLFILLSGSVDITKRLGLAAGDDLQGAREKTLVRLAAPQFFGEMALLGDRERTATVTASTDCELLEVSKADFDRLAEGDLRLGYRILHNVATVLCERLRHTDRDLLKLTVALSLALGNR